MREAFLSGVLAAVLGVSFCTRLFAGGQGEKPIPITLEVSVPASESSGPSPFRDGAQTYGKLVGSPAEVLPVDSTPGKQLADIKAAMALAAKQGKLDVSALPRKHRMFEISGILVDEANAVKELSAFTTPRSYDLTDFFARWSVALD